MTKNVYFISIVSVLLLTLLFFSGCSQGSAVTTLKNTTVESIESVSEEHIGNDTSNITEESVDEVPPASESVAETHEETEESANEGSSADDNPNIVRYKDTRVEIAQLYTVYAELHTSTISLSIDTETGLIDGYILLGYDDIRPVEDGRVECSSSLKGAIKGFYDAGSEELTAEVIGEIEAEGRLCFSGEIEPTLTLNFLEDGKYIEGSFKVPILTQFDFLLQKIE